MRKLTGTAPGHLVNGPTNHSGEAVWFVNGVTYVADNHPFVEYATVRGYTVETVASAPAPYTAAVQAMKDSGVVTLSSPLRDGAVDPQPGDNFNRPR
ncbi:hypothetical protein AB0I89_32110 [Micromonospora sp. NPDC049801]|uniref:hypothetical protein n=1 Tax=unclassified Micromonospora TaxID=2617518 RepID=UPI0033E43F53